MMNSTVVDHEFNMALANLYLVLMIAASLFNTLVIYLLISPQHQRRFRDFVILSQSLSDVSRILFSGFEEYKGLKNDKFEDGKTVCKIEALIIGTFEIVSIGHALLLVIDRYLCSYNQNFALILYTQKKYIVKTILMTYTYAVFWSIMPLVGFGKYGLQENQIQCGLLTKDSTITDKIYVGVRFLVIFAVPIIMILYFAYKVSTKINNVIENSTEYSNNILMYLQQDCDQITLVKAITICFIFTWLPYDIVLALETYGVTITKTMKYVELITGFLGHVSALTTPIIYLVFYKDLKGTLSYYLQKLFSKSSVSPENNYDANTSNTNVSQISQRI